MFRFISTKPNIILAPVGEAMFNAWKKYPELNLLQFDKHHTTKTGAYLVAATLYITIFNEEIKKTVHAMPFSQVDIDDQTKVKLNRLALEACLKYHLIKGNQILLK